MRSLPLYVVRDIYSNFTDEKTIASYFPLSLRLRFLLATAAVVLVLSLAYGMVALIGYSVSFDKTTFRLLRGESNLFYTLAKWDDNQLHVELPENIDRQSPTMSIIYDENGKLLGRNAMYRG